ncbi:hypothetical protein JAAARDRAFT_250106 [Jaapia argillacea MUCL 33604]|uniref:Uncharacterized protein n=1 Tax=Jaapia argillacea MUCL 33604 TaxID=933084 RepID=A0A067PSY3_9AGAM|nr:hypothetical protein JAAARDRAFT_250106 [Jaapia argillacea MUCL 33604]
MSDFKIYSRELSSLIYGHPLWEPNPVGYRRVEIGDVGYLRRGAFRRLFNILLPADDPSHEGWGVPSTFEQLVVPQPLSDSDSPLGPGTYHSRSVRTLSASATVSGRVFLLLHVLLVIERYRVFSNQIVVPEGGLSFSCSGQDGATLILFEPAQRDDAVRDRLFEQYINHHWRSWERFVEEQGLLVQLSDIVLVTGRDLTTRWSMAAFANSSMSLGGTVSAQVPGAVSATFSVSAGWQCDRSTFHHAGPQLSQLEPTISEAVEVGGPYPLNQCVFLRGFIAKRRKILPQIQILRASAGPHNLPGSGDRRPPKDIATVTEVNTGSSDEDTEFEPADNDQVVPIVFDSRTLLKISTVLKHLAYHFGLHLGSFESLHCRRPSQRFSLRLRGRYWRRRLGGFVATETPADLDC